MIPNNAQNPFSYFFKKLIFMGLLLPFLLMTACSSGDGGSTSIADMDVDSENPINTDPTGGGTPNETDPPEGCVESGEVTANRTSVNFGINQTGFSECQAITLSTCTPFDARITQTPKTSVTNKEEDTTADQDEFVLKSSGAESSSVSGAVQTVEVCYKRLANSDSSIKEAIQHTGEVVINASGNYVFVIPLSGVTLPNIIEVTTPNENNNVVMKGTHDFKTDGAATDFPYDEYFVVPTSGMIRVADYDAILKKNADGTTVPLEITVGNGGITTEKEVPLSGAFSDDLKIPADGKVHTVEYSVRVQTPAGTGTLTKEVDVIQLTKAAGEIEIRDRENLALVNAVSDDLKTSKSNSLIAGIDITNLGSSGPTAKYPIELSLIIERKYPKSDQTHASYYDWTSNTWKDAINYSDALARADELSYYKGVFDDVKFDPTDSDIYKPCADTFPAGSLCVPLPKTGLLGSGHNVVTAVMCNEVESNPTLCPTVSRSVIVTNDMPSIVITSPKENCIYPTAGKDPQFDCAKSPNAKGQVILKGYVTNYAPPTSTTVNNESVTTCSVRFWVNKAAPGTTDHISIKNNNILKDAEGIAVCPKIEVISGNDDDGNKDEFCDPSAESAVDSDNCRGNKGNIKKGTFEINLTELAIKQPDLLTHYTNLIKVEAVNTSGNMQVLVRSFQIGDAKKLSSSNNSNGNELLTQKMGNVNALMKANNGGNVTAAPIMLDISEGFLESEQVKQILRKLLNDNLKFADLALGGGVRENEHGKKIVGTGTIETSKDDDLNRLLHGSMPEQVRAIFDYWQDNGRYRYFPESQAQDACNQPLTTAIISPDLFKYVIPYRNPKFVGYQDARGVASWPRDACGINESTNPDCNTTEEGTWDIVLDIKDGGWIDVTLTLDGKTDENGVKHPAFWGHYSAFNLIEKGSSGQYATLKDMSGVVDPTIPLLMNIGKLKIDLKGMLRLYKVQKKFNERSNKWEIEYWNDPQTSREAPKPCTGGSNCTNMLYIDKDRVQASNDVLTFEPYRECKEYFQSKWKDANLPHGCRSDDKNNRWPFLVDTTSEQGEGLFEDVSKGDINKKNEEGGNYALLKLIHSVFTHTFKNVISCIPDYLPLPSAIELGDKRIDTLMLNSLIDPVAFPQLEKAPWLSSDNIIPNLKLAIKRDENNEIAVSLADETENAIFILDADLKNADILANNGSIKIRLPASIGTANVEANEGSAPWVHMFRPTTQQFDNEQPTNIAEVPYLSAAIGIEELLHSATSILFKKGTKPLLDLLDVDELTPPSHHAHDDWDIGLDKVVLGRLNICGSLAEGLLTTDLSSGITFSGVDLFKSESAHWDIKLDPNSPPTLFISEKIDENTFMLQLGITNLQIHVFDLIQSEDGSTYRIDDNEVLSVRVDGLVKLKTQIVPGENGGIQIQIFPPKYQETVIYPSVSYRNTLFDDTPVITSLEQNLFGLAFGMLSSRDAKEGQDPTGKYVINIPANFSQFNDVAFGKNGDEELEEVKAKGGVTIIDDTSLAQPSDCKNAEKPVYDSGQPAATISPDAAGAISSFFTSRSNTIFSDPVAIGRLIEAADYLDRSEREEPKCREDYWDTWIGDNDIKEAFCDLGIEEISFAKGNPLISFDADNGYLLFSSELIIDTMDWITEVTSLTQQDEIDIVDAPLTEEENVDELQPNPAL